MSRRYEVWFPTRIECHYGCTRSADGDVCFRSRGDWPPYVSAQASVAEEATSEANAFILRVATMNNQHNIDDAYHL